MMRDPVNGNAAGRRGKDLPYWCRTFPGTWNDRQDIIRHASPLPGNPDALPRLMDGVAFSKTPLNNENKVVLILPP